MKARIIDSTAVDVCENPEQIYHPALLDEFVDVPDNVKNGWTLIEGEWAEPVTAVIPEPPAEVPERVTVISPIAFKLRFPAEKRIAIAAARKNDPVIDDLWSLLDDPRYTAVDLTSETIIGAVQHLQSVDLIAADEATAILAILTQ